MGSIISAWGAPYRWRSIPSWGPRLLTYLVPLAFTIGYCQHVCVLNLGLTVRAHFIATILHHAAALGAGLLLESDVLVPFALVQALVQPVLFFGQFLAVGAAPHVKA